MLGFEPFIQLAAAALLGGLIGAERDLAGKRAGMRTHAMVALGAAFFTIISLYIVAAYGPLVTIDPARIAAAIVTGVGFIGAGLIIFHERDSVLHGVTTAAGLWVAAAVGMGIGFGFYDLSVFVTILVLVIFRGMWYVERTLEQHFGSASPDAK